MAPYELIFNLGNALILPCWVLLVFFPHAKITRWVFEVSKFNPLHVLAVFYAACVLPSLGNDPQAAETLARPTLEGLARMFASSQSIAAGWLHYLCFDLVVGVSLWKKARLAKQRFLWVSPVLLGVLMLGPVGWLLYELLSAITKKAKHLENVN